MHIKNYQEAVDQLYPFLQKYLESHGIDASKNFQCINPDHDDKNPSMGLAPSGNAFHCFGCGVSGGIFNAVAFLEDKPAHGPGFVSENLMYLADKFSVELEHEELTEEQLYELDTYRAYRIASEYITTSTCTDAFVTAITDRGWTRDTCNQYGIGCVSSHKEFKDSLKRAGFSAGFLGDIDLDRKDIFGEDRVVYTIRDDHGRPVGFASRNLLFTDDKKNGAKYVNQRGTGVKCNIYRKSERLFGFDLFLKRRGKGSDPIYIFEGYSDVVTAAQHGIWNSCALGGTALTQEHVTLLKEYNCYNIILCLDGDAPGQKRTAEILDERLGSHKDLTVHIINLPGGMDPDEHIRTNGVNKFKELEKWSAFEWRLNQFDDNEDTEVICKSMIPLIVNESSYIGQEKMAKILAKRTGITLKAVLQELGRIQNLREAEMDRDRRIILDRMLSTISRNPGEAEYALREAQTNLFDLSKRYETDEFSEESTLAAVNMYKHQEESLDGSFTGFRLGNDMLELEQALCGNWKKDVWLTLGGKPNCGKTSLLTKLLFEIARHDQNDACVIYHTIDDTLQQVLPKFVCVAQGSRQLTINQVSDPNYHIKYEMGTDILRKRDEGYSLVQDLIRKGRLVIKDSNNGSSLAYADMLIRYYKEKYPNRNIVYVLDNFHKLSDMKQFSDERVRFKEMSKVAKGIATGHHCCVITTVEYKKIDGEPDNNSIAETGQIEYDANLILHLYNEVHEKGAAATHRHEYDFENSEGTKICPRVSIKVGKNKITGFKNRLWFDFYPDSSDFIGVLESKVVLDAQKAKKAISEDRQEMVSKYIEFRQMAEQRGWQPGKAFFLWMDHFGFNKDDPEKKSLFGEVQNQAALL
jgi:DNA primase catalytic core